MSRFPSISKLISEVRVLPPSARVIPELQGLLLQANTRPEDVSNLLRIDSNLTTRVLRLANSAAFSRGVHCDVVDEAINRLGYEQINRIVCALAASELLDRELVLYRMDSGDLLRSGLAGALATSAFNQKAHYGENGDLLFTAGLLHSIGRSVLNDYMTKHHSASLEKSTHREFSPKMERALFGVDFAEVGAGLLNKWNFGPELTRLVQCSQKDCETQPNGKQLAVLQLGIDAIPYILDPELSAHEFAQRPAARYLSLPEAKIDEAFIYARQMFEMFSSCI